MKTSGTPEYGRWLGLAAEETLMNGHYHELFNQRQHIKRSEDGSLIWYAYFGEEPHRRKVIDVDENTHEITYLGYIGIYNPGVTEHVEVLFLEDGRTWLHIDYFGQDKPSDRRFAPIAEVTQHLEVVPEHVI